VQGAADESNRPDHHGWVTSGRWIGALLVVVVVLVVIAANRPNTPYHVAPAAADDATGPASDVPGTPVNVGSSNCGAGWSGGAAGPQTFALYNNSRSGIEVYLEDARTHEVYLDVEALGVAATRSAAVVLAPGTYRFYCVPDDTGPAAGPDVQVTGSYAGAVTPGLVPVTNAELQRPLQHYEDWVESRLPVLGRQVRRLDAAARGGDRAAARRDWLTAHLTYETLGAAYGAFGHYDDAIDGTWSTTTTALKDKHLAGFHKIEALLWSGAPTAQVAGYTHKLINAVTALHGFFATPHMSTRDLGLRSHEILEDAIGFELTGKDDAGSHTELATIGANLVGTRHALAPLRPILKSRGAGLARIDTWLQRSQRLVDSFRTAKGWIPLSRLSRTQHERLDATLDQTVELLSPVAVITEPRPAGEQ